jgi:monoamine oxidase
VLARHCPYDATLALFGLKKFRPSIRHLIRDDVQCAPESTLTPTLSQRKREPVPPLPMGEGWGEGHASDQNTMAEHRRLSIFTMNRQRRHWLKAAACTSLIGSAALSGCRDAAVVYQGQWTGANSGRGHRLRDQLAASKSGQLSAASSKHRASVLIVGAGVAGLACARALIQAGVDDVQVLELEDEAGGNSRSHAMGGMACPLGAHYLPVPDEKNPALLKWLNELQLCRFEHGRWVFDERHLCHSPQERVYLPLEVGGGHWFDGLLPPAQALPREQQAAMKNQVALFAKLVQTQAADAFVIPTARSVFSPELQRLDALSFGEWLDRQGINAPALRWYLDYCCRDDYGAGSRWVSAWAGLHYFASRHGFRAPEENEGHDDHAVLTWPEGNGWLSRRLAAPLRTASGPSGQRLHNARVVLEVVENRHDVNVRVWNDSTQQVEQWSATHLVLATPLFVTQRLLRNPRPALASALQQAAGLSAQAPWLVANVQLNAALTDQPGAPPSWDNVVYGSAALGYVDAMHQNTRPHPGPTVLTSYWALGGDDFTTLQGQRSELLQQPWSHWANKVLADLGQAHADLRGKVQQVDLMRYGHAMCVPLPGLRSSAALAALTSPASGRVHLAHSDLSAYSILEEAFFHGHRVGLELAKRLVS